MNPNRLLLGQAPNDADLIPLLYSIRQQMATHKEITLDLLPTHCNRRGLFLLSGGFHLWLTSLSVDLEIT